MKYDPMNKLIVNFLINFNKSLAQDDIVMV